MNKDAVVFAMANPTPEIMPEEYKTIMERDGKEKAVCDYISGMSDRYAVNIFNDIFIPKSWA